MKRLMALLLSLTPTLMVAQSGPQEGMIVRMRLGACAAPQHAFMMALSGSAKVGIEDPCPEYTLVTEKVVYVIVARASTQLVPLAESTRFRLQNRELLINTDKSKEQHFTLREMMLRSDWERQQHEEETRTVAREQEPDMSAPRTR